MDAEKRTRTSRLVEGDTLRHFSPVPSERRPPAVTDGVAHVAADVDRALVTFDCPVYAAGHAVPRHHHLRAQLLYAAAGVMIVDTDEGSWTVPPEQAVWIPAGTAHEVRMPCAVRMRSLYFRPDRLEALPARCRVVAITPLLRELIARLVAPSPPMDEARVERLVGVLLDEVRALRPPPLHLPMPRDARLRRIVRALIDDPSDPRDLETWASTVGASSRTLARLCRRELGMGFGAWRRQLRLITAVQRLGAGADVTSVALDLGYRSPSAFIAMFRAALGETPARYMRRRAGREAS